MSENRLAQQSSAYLRGAAHQPVHWLPWSEEAFDRARREDKPILLDIGAVWCHWCHVIDRESYDAPEVAKIINEHFVAIKVDRDERPDIDARYQNAVSAITGQGGWPLTGFLTPDGKVFFGGTYFPPEDSYGRLGFKHVLLSVAQYYREKKTDAAAAADQLHRQLAALGNPQDRGALDPSQLSAGIDDIRRNFDLTHGGFGTAPKFPHPSTIELLLRRYHRTRENNLLSMVTRTLEKVGRGGMHDQLGGGFHRYSTDARWVVPHFEKMLYDNAGLLGNYAHAYQATSNPAFRAVANDTAEFMAMVLCDGARGGFYGSQDADVSLDDDGSYFTWSEDEARAVLTADEFAVLAEHYHLQGQGEMHEEPRRHVLFIDRDADVIAAVLRKDVQEVQRLISSGRKKLAAARARRQMPYVDTAPYANWNGMAISAFLAASTALAEERYRTLALRALERFLAEGYTKEHGFVHVLAGPGHDRGGTGGVSGLRLLDDQVQMAQALLDAYEVTGDSRYLLTARDIADLILREYWDDAGGFTDVPRTISGPALEIPYKPVQDAPTPAPNAVGARVLLRLARLFNADNYRHLAERLLSVFVPALAPHGLHGSTMLIALDDFLHEPAHVTIVGPRGDPRTGALHAAALRTYRPDKLISLYPDGEAGTPLPDPVRAMITSAAEPRAYVCAGTACAQPTSDPQTLTETISTFGLS